MRRTDCRLGPPSTTASVRSALGEASVARTPSAFPPSILTIAQEAGSDSPIVQKGSTTCPQLLSSGLEFSSNYLTPQLRQRNHRRSLALPRSVLGAHWTGRSESDPALGPPPQASSYFSAPPGGSHTTGHPSQEIHYHVGHSFSRAGAHPGTPCPAPPAPTTPFSPVVPGNSVRGSLTRCREPGDHEPAAVGRRRASRGCQVKFLYPGRGSRGARLM